LEKGVAEQSLWFILLLLDAKDAVLHRLVQVADAISLEAVEHTLSKNMYEPAMQRVREKEREREKGYLRMSAGRRLGREFL
jgi:hypothetical protein